MVSLLQVQDVTVRFGGVVALDAVSFTVPDQSICGLTGPNGAGKATLSNVLSRLVPLQGGQLTFDNQALQALPRHRVAALGIGRTFQNLALFRSMTVRDNVLLDTHARAPRRLAGARAAAAVGGARGTRGAAALQRTAGLAGPAGRGRRAGGQPVLRQLQAGGAGPRAGDPATPAAAGRAGLRFEFRRGGATGRPHPHAARPLRADRAAGGAQRAPGDAHAAGMLVEHAGWPWWATLPASAAAGLVLGVA